MPKKSVQKFTTTRMLAKKVEKNDLDKLLLMYTNSEVTATLGGIRTQDQISKALTWNLHHWQQYGFGLWMLYDKKTREWLGRAGLRHINIEDQDEVELTYSLMPTFWHQGLATEIAKACVNIAFQNLNLNNLVCLSLKNNLPSQNVMKKVGFQYEKDFIHLNNLSSLYRLINRKEFG